MEVLGDLSRTQHRIVFLGLGFSIMFYISWFSQTEHMLGGIGIIEMVIGFPHLKMNQIPRQSNLADVMAGGTLNSHDVAFVKLQMLVVEVISLARIFELNLYVVAFGDGFGSIMHPIVNHERLVLTAGMAQTMRIVSVGNHRQIRFREGSRLHR